MSQAGEARQRLLKNGALLNVLLNAIHTDSLHRLISIILMLQCLLGCEIVHLEPRF